MRNQHSHRRSNRRLALLSATALGLCVALAGFSARAADGKKAKDDAVPAAAVEGEKVVLFNGKDMTGWKLRDEKNKETWKVVSSVKLDEKQQNQLVGEGEGGSANGVLFRQPLPAGGHGVDAITEKTFGDCELHIEFMVPKGSNSGVYLMGQYEVQVLDSFGKKKEALKPGDCGGIYNTKAPSENASKAPGEWQSFDITFRAPRFGPDGKKTENARFVKVQLNGKTIHENVEAPKATGSELPGGEKPTGPIFLQGDHGVVAYRNIWVKPASAK